MAPARGCIELELPLSILQSFHDLQTGQVIQLAGRAGKQGEAVNKKMNIRTERREESISLQLLTNSLGPSFKAVLERWKCLITAVIPQAKKSVIKSTRVHMKQQTASASPKPTLKRNTRSQRSSVEIAILDGEETEENILAAECFIENDSINSTVKHEANVEDDFDEPEKCSSSEIPEGNENEDKIDVILEEDNFVNDVSAPESLEELMNSMKTEKVNDDVNSEKVQCRFCAKSFTTNPARPMMALQQHETKFCKKNPWSRTTLEPKPVKSEKFPCVCKFCPQAFRLEKQKKNHEMKCSRNPEYMVKFDMEALMICDICNHMCANELGLAYHRSKTHGCCSSQKPRKPRKSTPCPCRFCGKIQNNHSTRFVHEHFRCTSNPDMRPGVRCQHCTQMCTQDKLESHIAKHHIGQEHHVCEVCGKVYPGKHKLYQHRMTHKELRTPKHKCPLCDKIYVLKARLKIHMARHSDARDVQCSVCGKCFKNKHQENKHRVLIHENRYRYRCSKCGHGMAKKIYLENHKCGRVRRKQKEDVLEMQPEINDIVANPNSGIGDVKSQFPVATVPHVMPVVHSVPMNIAQGYEFYPGAQEVQPYLIPQTYQHQGQILAHEHMPLQYFTS